MLDCCEPLDKVKAQGITFGKVACLAHCSGADVQPFRASQITVDDLRRHLIRCTSSRDCHLIASYHRKPLKQVRKIISAPLFYHPNYYSSSHFVPDNNFKLNFMTQMSFKYDQRE
jgi:hypothetical protein